MKLYAKAVLVTLFAATTLWGVGEAGATPTTILDTYIGADPTHDYAHVDSIGGLDFNLTEMVVDFVGTTMQVDIHSTRYFDKDLPFENTLLGDLFISTNGLNTPYPGGDSAQDTMATGEKWEFVAVLDTHGENSETSGTVSLYAVEVNKIIATNLNGLNPNYWIYRANQEWAYDITGQTAIGTAGTWTRGDNMLSLSFEIPTSWNATEYGFHWGMSCGNDIIQGAVTAPVPEPATTLLFGIGTAGLAAVIRRRKS